MTKRAKKRRKPSKRNAKAKAVESNNVEIEIDPASRTLVDLAKDEIRAQLELIGKERETNGEFNKDLALGTAALMRSLVAADSEERQRRKAEVHSLSEFQVDQIADHLKVRLDDAEREDFAKRLMGTDGEESLL